MILFVMPWQNAKLSEDVSKINDFGFGADSQRVGNCVTNVRL